MSEVVLIPVGPDVIALDRQAFEEARQRARDLLPSPTNSSTAAPEPLLTAEALAALLNVPQSQISALGRQGRLPSVTVGKYRRYSYAQALAALSVAK